METKVCTKCGLEKPIEDFAFRDKAKGTRRADCKECHSKFMKNKYQEKRQEVQQLKSEHCCAKCGYNKCPEALEFHHVDPAQKETTVARLLANGYGLKKALEEIKKCIILCANCHREFHYLEKLTGITIEDFLKQK